MEQRKPSRIDHAYRPPEPDRIGQAPAPKRPEPLPKKPKNSQKMSDKPKNTIKNAVLRVVINQIWHFIRTWLVAKPVYVSAPDELGNIVPVRDPDTGQKKINWIATVAGRVIQLLGVVGWLPVVLWGQPLDWWVELLSKIGNLF